MVRLPTRRGIPAGSSRRSAAALLLVPVLALMLTLALRQAAGPDVGFHLRAGEYVLAGQGWPTTDPFTFSVSERPYIDTSWGYQVLLAAVQRAAGAPGMVLLHAGLLLAALLLVVAAAGPARVPPEGLAALLLIGGLAAELRFAVRPEVVSWALLAAVLLLLQRHAAGGRARLELLPALFLVWANVHSLFVLGWAALACFVVGLLLRDRRLDRRLAGWSTLSLLAPLVNPYGWKGVVFPFTLATRMNEANAFARHIGEFASPWSVLRSDQFEYYSVPLLSFCAFVVLATLALPGLLRARRFADVLLFVAFVPLSLAMLRNIPLPVIACLPGTLHGLAAPARRLTRRGAGGLRRVAAVAVLLACAVLLPRVFHDAYYVDNLRSARFGLGWNRLTLPVDAAAWAVRHDLSGRVLNHLNFGGYLMWATGKPVFIDGRLEVMGEEFFEDYRRVLASRPHREAAVARYGIGWLVFPYKIAPRLLGELSRDPAWRLIYVDALAAIFVRADANPGVTADPSVLRAPPRVDPATLPGLGGPARPSRLVRWLGGFVRRQEFPTDPFQRGLFHLFVGEPDAAAAQFAEAVRRSQGRYTALYQNLGAALYRAGRLAEARDCYRLVLAEDPANPALRRRLDEIERRSGAVGGPPP